VLAPNDDHNDHPVRHPRALTVAQRELVVRNGLGDREPAVKAAAANLLVSWVEIFCDKERIKNETSDNADAATAVDDVIAFLKMFDLLEGTVAEDALLSVFSSHVNLFERLKFGGMLGCSSSRPVV
jgi:condensin complex subunit 3